MAFINKYKIRGGRIQLYQRSAFKSSVNGKNYESGTWYAAFKLPNKPTIRRSLKTTSKEDAEELAEDTYQELKYKDNKGLALSTKKFTLIAKQYKKLLEQQYKNNINLPKQQQTSSPSTNAKKLAILRKYIITYDKFINKNIGDINDQDIEDYIEDRKNYWSIGEGAKETKQTYTQNGRTVRRNIDPATRKQPKYSSINKDLSIIRAIYEYARKERIIDGKQIPTIKNLVKPKNYIDKKPGITIEELYKIQHESEVQIKNQKNPKHKRAHILLGYYIQIMCASGMRVTESFNIKFSDISTVTNNKGEQFLSMNVHGKGKRRQIIPMSSTKGFIDSLKKLHKANAKKFFWKFNNDMELFINDKGKPIKSFKKGIDALLSKADLLYSEDNIKRSAGTFRKFYITTNLINGVNVYDLATNCGSLVSTIEKYYSELEPKYKAEMFASIEKHDGFSYLDYKKLHSLEIFHNKK